jgi:hypothetical protein
MRNLSEALYLVVVTLWVGGLWAIGYLTAPVLFASLGDRQLAGVVAGKLFSLIGWIGLGGAAYLMVFLFSRWGAQAFKRAVFWLVIVMALLTAASQFGIQPLMAQLKADALPREVMESVLRDRFAAWHGVSSILYLVQSVLGLWLVVWSSRGLRFSPGGLRLVLRGSAPVAGRPFLLDRSSFFRIFRAEDDQQFADMLYRRSVQFLVQICS